MIAVLKALNKVLLFTLALALFLTSSVIIFITFHAVIECPEQCLAFTKTRVLHLMGNVAIAASLQTISFLLVIRTHLSRFLT